MLFRPQGRVQRTLSFDQQLSCLANSTAVHPDFQKSQQGFKMILTVLELIIGKSPQYASELLVIKQALSKWYEHIQEQHLSQTRQIYNLRQKTIVSIKKEVGITLEEIAYYLRSVLQQYQDQHMETYYVKYLLALKKLDWDRAYILKTHNNADAQTQTLLHEGNFQQCSSPHIRGKVSLSTIETPQKKSYKQIDIHKYLEAKEENLALQRQIDRLKSKLAKLEQQLAQAMDENSHLKQNQEKCLQQMAKLTEMLGQHKESENREQEKQKEVQISWQMTTSKYPKTSLKHAVSKELDFAEEQIRRKEQQNSQIKADDYFSKHYEVRGDSCLQSQNTQRKGLQEFSQDHLLRMLMTQALSIEDFMNGNIEEE